jgi:hypothetical protein
MPSSAPLKNCRHRLGRFGWTGIDFAQDAVLIAK